MHLLVHCKKKKKKYKKINNIFKTSGRTFVGGCTKTYEV